MTVDVSVIEIYTNPGRQARSKTLLYYLKLTTTRILAHYGRAGISRVSARGGGGGGGEVLQVRPGTISGGGEGEGWGGRGVGVLSASDPIRKVGALWYRGYSISDVKKGGGGGGGGVSANNYVHARNICSSNTKSLPAWNRLLHGATSNSFITVYSAPLQIRNRDRFRYQSF